MIPLYPYQEFGARWLAPLSQAFLADDMGLGKSAQAIHGADLNGLTRILVVCPAVAKINWEREFERFSLMGHITTVLDSAKDSIPTKGVVVCSFEIATAKRKELAAGRWDLLIVDEAHYLKERSAKRTKALYGHGKRQPGIAQSSDRVWRLSGTPCPNYADEMWTHLKSAGIIEDPYWDFTFRYCTGFDHIHGFKITGHKNVEELKKILEPFMLRRKKDDVLKDLPPIRYQEVTVAAQPVELDPTFYEQIHQIGEKEFLANIATDDCTLRNALDAMTNSLKADDMDRVSLLEAMAAPLMTLRRYIAMAKLQSCLDIIEEDLKNGMEKIVIFAVHQCVIEGARQRLAKYIPVTLYGKTPSAKRQANVDRFMNDRFCRVFIGNIQAAGTAITLTSACEGAFVEQAWTPAENAQAAMRIHRIGQTRPVRIRVFSLGRSVDEQVQQILMRKSKALAQIF